MRLSRIAGFALGTALTLGSCADDDVDIREGPSGMLADSTVLQAMRSSDSGGRIIYAPPADLSLTSAQQRRPDIFRVPTPAAKPVAPKDTAKTRGR
jgi:hypothetical protein